MMHAASGKTTTARNADLLGGDCGPGPAEGGRVASRSIFATCSLKRASCSSARANCSRACASCSSARADQGISCLRSWCGVHWRFPSPSNVIRKCRLDYIRLTGCRHSVQSCPKNGGVMEEYTGSRHPCPKVAGKQHHSITSVACARIVFGTVRPSVFAVLRLMMRSNFVGCSTGRSAGFSPLRILPT